MASSTIDLVTVVTRGKLGRVRKILQSGADPNINRGKGYYWRDPVIPLHVAASNGQLEMVKCLLQFKADVEIVDAFGGTALHCAARNGRDDVIELLISHNADVYKQDCIEGATALHWACRNGHLTCAGILLRQGADAALRDNSGKTARDLAGDKNKSDIVKLLDDFVIFPADWKEKLHELDSVKAELAALKAEKKQSSASNAEAAQLTPLKTEAGELSLLRAEVDKLLIPTTELGQPPTLRTAIEQLATKLLRIAVNDLSPFFEEPCTKKDQLQPGQSNDSQ